MKTSLWSLVLCAGLCAAALLATRSAEAERPRVDEAPVCIAAADDESGDAMCGKCGDGYCNPRCGETATSCPKDCGGTTY